MANDSKQTVTRRGDRAHFGHQEFRWANMQHTPSWERYGNGRAFLYVDTGKPENPWLSICAEEHGEKSSRMVMMSLDAASALKLYQYLHSVYGEQGDGR